MSDEPQRMGRYEGNMGPDQRPGGDVLSQEAQALLMTTNVLDYPSNLSMYEKESLVLKGRLARERNKKKNPRPKPA
jgi:hypothetical protein